MSEAAEGGGDGDPVAGAEAPDDLPDRSHRFHCGDLVVDVEDGDPDADEAVVVNRPPVLASDWGVYYDRDLGEEVTVADDNPGYPDDDPVVVVAFAPALEDARPDYDGGEALPLSDLSEDVPVYAFPEGRLERVGHYRGPTTGSDDSGAGADTDAVDEEGDSSPTRDDLEALADRLHDGAEVTVRDPDEEDATPWVRVDKLGSTYLIHADGDVDGDGPHADAIREVAADYLGGGTA
jgi:hypothetical protein